MHVSPNFFNWSLKKAINTLDNPIKKARMTVFVYLFFGNFLKIGIFLPEYIKQNSGNEIIISIIGFVLTLVILKILLWKPQYLQGLIFVVLTGATLSVWYSLLVDKNAISLITFQDIFMIVMWSFYGLSGRWGYIYSGAAILPILGTFLLNPVQEISIGLPGTAINASLFVIAFNFVVIIIAHHYYRSILYSTIDSSDQLNDELANSNDSKNMFFATMSHELRTPLNSVIGMANLLIEDNRDKEQKENLDILKFSAESLLSLINDILDFNKIGSGKIDLEHIPFNLNELLENACAGLRIKAMEKNLFCITSIDAELAENDVIGDPTRLLQIIYNLVGNSIKFTKKGGIEIQVQVLNRINDRLSLRFIVQDTGLGISKEQQQIIFEPFTQANVNTTRKFGGTGLGLSIVKHLLTLHHSTIHVESELNKGAKFYFDIDYQVTQKHEEPVTEVSPKKNKDAFSNLKILLAEDNPMNILFMKKLFARWDIEIDLAENGQEVLNLLQVNNYDLILMDIQMPVMNGYEAAVQIRAMSDPLKSATHIIALTASVSSDVNTNVLEAGMNDSLSKPFKPDELYAKLERLAIH